jgi:hypothetical protein
MMEEKRLAYRMYFFVPYHLSDIQKGIQAGHAALEYAKRYKDDLDFMNFVFWDKTWVILDGGTSNDSHYGHIKGSMEEICNVLHNNGIKCTSFNEPDLNSAMTAICFLADERVWNYEIYPTFVNYFLDIKLYPEAKEHMPPENALALKIKSDKELQKLFPEYHVDWIKFIGGEKNVFLRELLKNQKLA